MTSQFQTATNITKKVDCRGLQPRHHTIQSF